MTARPGFYFFCIVLALCLASCQPASAPAVLTDTSYFPLTAGQFIVYDVEEQQFSLNALPVRRYYQLKETLGTPYADLSGQPAYRLLRHRRLTDGQPWQPDSVWTARLVNNEAIRGENGRDIVALVFPLSNGLHWNGNRYNLLGPDEYELRNTGQPYRVEDKQFDDTVTVIAQDDSTLVSQDKRKQVYARGIGLIYQERSQLAFCTTSPNCRGKTQIDYGIRQIYRIHAYGKE